MCEVIKDKELTKRGSEYKYLGPILARGLIGHNRTEENHNKQSNTVSQRNILKYLETCGNMLTPGSIMTVRGREGAVLSTHA